MYVVLLGLGEIINFIGIVLSYFSILVYLCMNEDLTLSSKTIACGSMDS